MTIAAIMMQNIYVKFYKMKQQLHIFKTSIYCEHNFSCFM